MNGPVRWGVVGSAAIARNKVIPAMHRAAGCEVLALASRDAQRAADVARALRIARSYDSYEALLDDGDVDAVYIPLPNSMHMEWTLKAAAAGKHVLCEKPLAMTADEATIMVDACRDAGVLLMEAFMYRLHPMWVAVRDIVASGRIGQLRAIQSNFTYANSDPANIRNHTELGGGALMDIGCYPINVARMMFQAEPTTIQATMLRDASFGTDVLTSAVLDFGGRQATFTCSTQLQDDQRVHLTGTTGRLLIEIPFNIPTDQPTRIVLSTGGNAGAVPRVSPDVDVIDIPAADQYQVQVEQFAAAIRDGTQAPIPADDAIANMAVIDKVVASARRHSPRRS